MRFAAAIAVVCVFVFHTHARELVAEGQDESSTLTPKEEQDGLIEEQEVASAGSSRFIVLRSGGGSRSMVISTLWDLKLGLSQFPQYGLSGGAWGLAARGIRGAGASAVELAQWKVYLAMPPSAAELQRDFGTFRILTDGDWTPITGTSGWADPEDAYIPPAWEGKLRRFLGSYFNRLTAMTDNYFGYKDMWINYMKGAIQRPLHSSSFKLVDGDHILIGYGDERFMDGTFKTFSVVDVDSSGTWTVHHPDGSSEKITSLAWPAKYVIGGPTFRNVMPVNVETGLLFSSSAFVGLSRAVGFLRPKHNMGVQVEATVAGKERRAQLWDLGNDCNIPFPFWLPDTGKVFVSIDSSGEVPDPYNVCGVCTTIWEGWGWKATRLSSFEGFKADVGGGSNLYDALSKDKTGISILKLTKGDKVNHLINIPIAKFEKGYNSMWVKGIWTFTKSAAPFPWRHGLPEVQTMEHRVKTYFEQLRAVNAIPTSISAVTPSTTSAPSAPTPTPAPSAPHRSESGILPRVKEVLLGDPCECSESAFGAYQPAWTNAYQKCGYWGEDYTWCYVVGGQTCTKAQVSSSDPTKYWKKCSLFTPLW